LGDQNAQVLLQISYYKRAITEALQSYVHVMNGSEYRVCSSDEQPFFSNVQQMNALYMTTGIRDLSRVCVTADFKGWG